MVEGDPILLTAEAVVVLVLTVMTVSGSISGVGHMVLIHSCLPINGSGKGGGSYGLSFEYYEGGGGGSAGAILIASFRDHISISGNIKANGGKGGNSYLSGAGGGGAGGESG